MLAIMGDEHGYSSSDLPLYFEWHGDTHGSQPPLLLVHGGGSTIESNWDQQRWSGRDAVGRPASGCGSPTRRRICAVSPRRHGRRVLGRLIPNARMLIVPGNHGDYLGEPAAAAGDPGPLRRTLPFIVDFLDQPETTTPS
jgi:hypothetical protein